MKSYGSYKSPWILVILLVIGGIFGSIVGEALGSVPALAVLSKGREVGLPVTTLDLEVLAITFGFTFKVNLISLLGFVLAFFIYRRL
ncbi:MAG: Uncharacterized protein XD63_1387 [Thermoanaerobacterales bacterium 50_218]|nr:MAG: Uncharacterized protein XD63_1387 [Thermoanaerobacterales bacterium 50_218]HAA90788.1 DUF4321 domain-containing protein [Peptococcaceae bacterium]